MATFNADGSVQELPEHLVRAGSYRLAQISLRILCF